MIVTCEQCQAQFRLDDSKVPEGGARVRCSKCKHAFFIEPPGREDSVAADALARDALAGGPEEAESDWQFNDDTPQTAPQKPQGDLEAARQAVDGLLGDAPAAEAVDGSAPEPAPEGPSLDAGELDARPAAEEPEEGDLGDPESWDLLADDDADRGSAQIGQVALMPRWKVLEEQRAGSERALDERAAAAATSDDVGSGRVGRLLQGVLAGIGWCAVLVLVAGGLRAGLSPVSAASAPAAAELSAGGFRAAEVQGRWIENASGGQIYVISGWLHHGDASGRPVTGPLAARLLDADGRPVDAPSTPVGPPFPTDALRQRAPAELLASQSRAAGHFARLSAGERIRFQALFADVPSGASRFVLEPVAPAPAPQAPAGQPDDNPPAD